MINKIKTTLNSCIGASYNSLELISTEVSNEILNLKDNLTDIEDNSIGDIEITHDDQFYIVDVKIQDIDKVYSVPNLISIKKAKDILKNHDNHIIYVFVEYKVKDFENIDMYEASITNIRVQPIETLDWSYLAIQNLGRGQLQIKNTANGLTFNPEVTRTTWFGEFKEKAIEYYNNLILKVTEYKTEFEDD